MASSYSTNAGLELVTTGEKAGLWGTITNTNLQILEQTATGYLAVDMAGASVTLTLTDGSTSNGKNIYLALTGTLSANRTLTMPVTANRIWIVKDETARGTSNRTLGVLTASGTTTQIPPGATVLCRSNGSETDARGTWGSNNLTVGRNGLKINSGTSDLTLSNNGQSITLVYVDSTRGWAYKTNYTS
jgi:hypothetical protein